MPPKLTEVFDEAENRYLTSEELKIIAQYVASLPERLETYCSLRDRELQVMEAVVTQLQTDLPEVPADQMERSIKQALLMLRCCALSLLLDDEALVQRRFLSWVQPLAEIYRTQSIDARLYGLLNQQLSQALTERQMRCLRPSLAFAQETILSQHSSTKPMVVGN